jgi:hypothetical protein
MALSLAGCYHARVTTHKAEVKSKTANTSAWLWGVVQPEDLPADCASGQIASYRTTVTFPQAFATVVTLGIWCPITLEWECGEGAFPER